MTPAGWYPHPSMPQTLGYWDGEAWTDRVAPMQPATPVHVVSGGMDSSQMVFGLLAVIAIVAAVIWTVLQF